MKLRGKNMVTLLAGILVGMALAGPVANAATEYFQAQRTPHPIYVDGQQVQMETYTINGHNYVKLRDIGEKVGFEVYWDGSAAQIVSDQPYTGLPPVQPPAPTKAPTTQDYSAQANSAIFTGELTRENYNAIRDTVLHRDEIAAGSYQPVQMGAFTRYGIIDEVTAAIGGYPVYEPIPQPDGSYVCTAKCPESYKDALAHTQSFLNGLAGMTDSEKVTAMAWYVADRITYAVKYPTPSEVLAQDGQFPGACMSYAYSFRFLCDRAGIPCILIQSQDHQWNQVYVDGQWRDVDVTSIDVEDVEIDRSWVQVLKPLTDIRGDGQLDKSPEVTVFAKELLVPGSTK